MKAPHFISAIFAALLLAACGNANQTANENAAKDSLIKAPTDTVKAPEDKSKRESPPKSASFDVNGVKVNLNWGSPKVKGRVIWGDLVPYGEVWRTGANEATTIEFDKNAKVGGKDIPAGKYGLFTVPEKKEWTVVFNTRPDQWGAYEYEKEKDQLRIPAKPETGDMHEELEFTAENGKVYMNWEKLKVGFTIETGK